METLYKSQWRRSKPNPSLKVVIARQEGLISLKDLWHQQQDFLRRVPLAYIDGAEKVFQQEKTSHSLEVGEMHPIMSQESVGDTHLERPELCSPSNNAAQAHLYN